MGRAAVVALCATMATPAFAVPLDQDTQSYLEGTWILTASPKLTPRCKLPWKGGTSDSDGNEIVFALRNMPAKLSFADGVDFYAQGTIVSIQRDSAFIVFRAQFPGSTKDFAVKKLSKDRMMLRASTGKQVPNFDGGTLLRCGP